MSMSTHDRDAEKAAAAEAAVAEIRDGMLVGLGSGSTAAYAVRAVGRRRGPGPARGMRRHLERDGSARPIASV